MSDESNISGKGEDYLLAAEYALGVLDDAARETLQARLKAEPGLRAELALWQDRLSSLDDEFDETPPPARLWSRVEQRLFSEPARSSFWQSLQLWRSVAAGAVAVAVVAVGINVMTPRPDPKAFAAQLVAALTAEGSDVSFVALYNETTGQLRLTALSGTDVPDKDYELWAIEGEQAPKSMGVISASTRNDVPVAPEILVDFGAGTVLAVTLEQKGGSPTGKAQGPIVALGKATQI